MRKKHHQQQCLKKVFCKIQKTSRSNTHKTYYIYHNNFDTISDINPIFEFSRHNSCRSQCCGFVSCCWRQRSQATERSVCPATSLSSDLKIKVQGQLCFFSIAGGSSKPIERTLSFASQLMSAVCLLFSCQIAVMLSIISNA